MQERLRSALKTADEAHRGKRAAAATLRDKKTPWQESLTKKRDPAIKEWADILATDLSKSTLGLQICEPLQDSSIEFLIENVYAVLAVKATTTISLRANSMKAFLGWVKRKVKGLAMQLTIKKRSRRQAPALSVCELA
eukprot:6025263-Amphidinium_carterae.1